LRGRHDCSKHRSRLHFDPRLSKAGLEHTAKQKQTQRSAVSRKTNAYNRLNKIFINGRGFVFPLSSSRADITVSLQRKLRANRVNAVELLHRSRRRRAEFQSAAVNESCVTSWRIAAPQRRKR
jgi:hypothetical protein